MSMRMRHVAIMTVMFAWQNAPITAERDEETGRTRIAFGAGAYSVATGTFVSSGGDCAGPPTYREDNVREGVGSAGAAVDVSAGGNLRVTAAGGYYHSGPFGGFLLAWEGRRVGIGAGWGAGRSSIDRYIDQSLATQNVRVGLSAPAGYLRIGEQSATHVRADAMMPATSFLVTGRARAGLAFGEGRTDIPQVFLGIAALQIWAPQGAAVAREVAGGFIEFNFATSARADIQVRSHISKHGVGIGAGIRSQW